MWRQKILPVFLAIGLALVVVGASFVAFVFFAYSFIMQRYSGEWGGRGDPDTAGWVLVILAAPLLTLFAITAIGLGIGAYRLAYWRMSPSRRPWTKVISN